MKHTLATAAFLAATLFAQDSDKEKLRTALKDTDLKGAWFYDDLPGATAEAKKTGKPLLVIFRCVP